VCVRVCVCVCVCMCVCGGGGGGGVCVGGGRGATHDMVIALLWRNCPFIASIAASDASNDA
jgi:hypothetical protein